MYIYIALGSLSGAVNASTLSVSSSARLTHLLLDGPCLIYAHISTTMAPIPTATASTNATSNSAISTPAASPAPNNHTLIIALATGIPLLVVLLIICMLRFVWHRKRIAAGRNGPFSRASTPVTDAEIEGWKTSNIVEKRAKDATAAALFMMAGSPALKAASSSYPHCSLANDTGPNTSAATRNPSGVSTHTSYPSDAVPMPKPLANYWTKKPANLVVNNPSLHSLQHNANNNNKNDTLDRQNDAPSSSSPPPLHTGSTAWSPSSIVTYKTSLDCIQSPVLARAPNARPGLTDDSIRADEPYTILPTSPSQPLRSSKHSVRSKHQPLTRNSSRHTRDRSDASSWYNNTLHSSYGSTSPMVHATRQSNEYTELSPPPPLHQRCAPASVAAGHATGPTSWRSSIENFYFFDQEPDERTGAARRQVQPVEAGQGQSLDVGVVLGGASLRPEDIGRAIG